MRSTPRRAAGVAAAIVAMALGLQISAAQAGTQPGTQPATQPGRTVAPSHPAPTRSTKSVADAMGTRADLAIQAAERADNGTETAFAYSWLASAIAHRSSRGWDDPAALAYLGRAMAQQMPDGGYGLNYRWDAFGDGTVNPASTEYTITFYQVGEVLIEAYRAGKVPYSAVTDVLRRVYATPQIRVSVGMALAYSNSGYDVKPGYVVHNIDQGIAMLLADAQAAGIDYSKAQSDRWIAKLNQQEVSAYQPAIHGWTYRNGSAQPNDPAHNALGIADMVHNEPTIGRTTLDYAMANDLGSTGPLAHAFLGSLDCLGAGRWLPEYDVALASPRFQTFAYWAQFARMDALTQLACSTSHEIAPHH